MILKCFFVFICILGCGKLPRVNNTISSVKEVVKEFNYCLRHITNTRFSDRLENLLTGKALEDFYNIQSELSNFKKQGNTFIQGTLLPSKQLFHFNNKSYYLKQFIHYAQTLWIHIIQTQYKDNEALCTVVYHNDKLLTQEKKELVLEKRYTKWKIKNIRELR